MVQVLFSTFGSAGDLFPLLPVAAALRGAGHEVVVAAPRSLGLFVRVLGFTPVSLGDGSEMRVVTDDDLFTTRFDGWASYRRMFVDYVAPGLSDDVARMARVIERTGPDVVVTLDFGVAARIAALAAEVPHLACTVTPQFRRFAGRRPPAFARPFLDVVRARCPAAVIERHGLGAVAFGAGPGALVLHDPLLIGAGGAAPAGDAEVVGYPYYDAADAAAATGAGAPDAGGSALERARSFVAGPDDRPVVLATFGSFVGAAANRAWAPILDAARAAGVRLLVANARPEPFAPSPDALAVPYVALSAVAPHVVGVVHHGGVGTTIGALRAGRPSVVVPQAFDQPRMARMVEAAGVGLAATAATLPEALHELVTSGRLADAAREAAGRLVPTATAVARVVAAVLAAAELRDPATVAGRARA